VHHRKYATLVFVALVVCGVVGVALRYRARHDIMEDWVTPHGD